MSLATPYPTQLDLYGTLHIARWRPLVQWLLAVPQLIIAYPPFDFQPTAADDGADPHTVVTFTYPQQMSRWQPLVKWLLAVPHYLVLAALGIAATVVVIAGFFAVLVTGEYPQRLRDFLVAVYRYSVRVQAYVGLLTDQYPPYTLQAR